MFYWKKWDGLSLTKKIREDDFLSDVKIILFFNDQYDEVMEIRAFEAGVNDFLYQPFRLQALSKRLSRHLRKREDWFSLDGLIRFDSINA